MKKIDEFFWYARERQDILVNRDYGERKPWTRDPVLQQYRFCNIFREDDRTTQWFRENIRRPLDGSIKVVSATVAFRWFNKIETGEAMKEVLLDHGWDRRRAEPLIRKAWEENGTVISSAYMIRSPDGFDKVTGLCNWIDEVHYNVGEIDSTSLENCHKWLRQFPGMGPFIAYEVVTDLRHTYLLRSAADIMTWASAGPGAARGLEWVWDGDLSGKLSHGSKKHQVEMNARMRTVLELSRDEKNWPNSVWGQWEMREVEHTLCEFDKYCRAKYLGQRLKRNYVHNLSS